MSQRNTINNHLKRRIWNRISCELVSIVPGVIIVILVECTDPVHIFNLFGKQGFWSFSANPLARLIHFKIWSMRLILPLPNSVCRQFYFNILFFCQRRTCYSFISYPWMYYMHIHLPTWLHIPICKYTTFFFQENFNPRKDRIYTEKKWNIYDHSGVTLSWLFFPSPLFPYTVSNKAVV